MAKGDYGQYHSAYDTFDHYTRFMDPTFEYGVALARVAGRAVLRLANADVLPFDAGGLLPKLETYVNEVIELADGMREETERDRRRIAQGVHVAAADPTRTYVPPEAEEPVPASQFRAAEERPGDTSGFRRHAEEGIGAPPNR